MEGDKNCNDSRSEESGMQTPLNFIGKVRNDFSTDFLDEKACRLWLLKSLHPEGARCPRCGKAIVSERGVARFHALERVFCKYCKKLFTGLTGTIFNGMQIDIRTVFAIILFSAFKIDKKEIARMLNISPETVAAWERKFNAVVRQE